MSNEVLTLWADNVRTRRLALDISQAEFARRCDVTAPTACKWESGKTAPKDDHKVRIAEVLDVDVRALFPLVRGTAA